MEQTLAETLSGPTWSVVSAPDSGTSSNVLNSVTCTSSTACVAVGYYINSSGVEQTLAEQYGYVCNGGSLNLTSPASTTFPGVTLNGSNQTRSTSLTLTPDDETGTGNGWNID
ncbi:MAG: hypothetical protein ACYDB3_09670, partial [Acidimicrobiales bacterium]